MGFTAADLATVRQGRAAVRTLDHDDRREVALAGLIRIEAPRQRIVDGWRDMVTFRKNEQVLEMGAFGRPPRLADLAALTVDRQDIDDLAQCRPGSCKVQLTASDIERLRREVDWQAASHVERATALMRAVLFAHLERYQADGLGGLGAYADRREPVRIDEELRAVLEQVPSPLGLAPELLPHLVGFPRTSLAGAEDDFYWSKDKFGFKPITALIHTTIYLQPPPGGVALLVSRQIYANHYFDASVGITALLDVPGGEEEVFDLLYVNRTRSARMTGFFGTLARPIAQSRGRSTMARLLEGLKRRTERAPGAAP